MAIGHFRCCCRICNPKDTEPSTCGTCDLHEPNNKPKPERKPKPKPKQVDK